MDADIFSKYINTLIRIHLGLTYKRNALQIFDQCPLVYLPLENIDRLREPCLAIPNNVPATLVPKDIVRLEFNQTTYTLYNKIPRPSDKWETISHGRTPLWYRNKWGVVMPAWNHFANIVDLLSFRAEREISDRDGQKALRLATEGGWPSDLRLALKMLGVGQGL